MLGTINVIVGVEDEPGTGEIALVESQRFCVLFVRLCRRPRKLSTPLARHWID